MWLVLNFVLCLLWSPVGFLVLEVGSIWARDDPESWRPGQHVLRRDPEQPPASLPLA